MKKIIFGEVKFDPSEEFEYDEDGCCPERWYYLDRD